MVVPLFRRDELIVLVCLFLRAVVFSVRTSAATWCVVRAAFLGASFRSFIFRVVWFFLLLRLHVLRLIRVLLGFFQFVALPPRRFLRKFHTGALSLHSVSAGSHLHHHL